MASRLPNSQPGGQSQNYAPGSLYVAAKNAFRDKKLMPEDFSKTDGLLDYLYNLDTEIRNFSESLQEQLKLGQVDIYSPQPPLKKP